MIYVFREGASDGAYDLADAVNGRRVRVYDNGVFRRRAGTHPMTPRSGDTVVCWGDSLPAMRTPGVRLLNGAQIPNKFTQAQVLSRNSVPTIQVSQVRPTQTLRREIMPFAPPVNNGINRAQAAQYVATLTSFINEPEVPVSTWLGRRNNHVGGSDLLQPPTNPDFYSKKEDLVEEFRLHVFEGKSIRAGKKVHREGVAQPHPWIRSYDAGWKIQYDDFHSKESMRNLATNAVAALGLNFGAVDIGRKKDKSLIVLEVNTAAGLENNTITAYANAIQQFAEGPVTGQ